MSTARASVARRPARGPRTDAPPSAPAPTVGLAAGPYRRRATPLHAARPLVAAAWCGVLVALALVASHPLLLLVLLATVLGAGARVGARAAQARTMRLAVPLAVVLVLIQLLIDHRGLTVLARLGTVPVLGALDVTAEALTSAVVLALRVLCTVAVAALASSAIDPDRLLMALRRAWPSGALTAALALRIVPVLARDGARMADARRCRPAGVPGAHGDRGARLLVVRAVTASALERASDLSATLELRGHGLGVRPAPRDRRGGASRHDLAIGASAVALVAVGVAGVLTGAADAVTDPELRIPLDGGVLALAVALPVLVLSPVLSRRGTAA